MKKNFAMFGLPRWGVGAALLALFALAPASRAALDIEVNNLAATTTLYATAGGYYGQEFTMDSSSGNLSILTLKLDSSGGGTADIYLYNVSGGVPTAGSGVVIGHVLTGTTFNLTSNPNLNANASYAILVHDTGGDVRWNYTASTATGGNGSFPSPEVYGDGASIWNFTGGNYFQMELGVDVVPEVPMTGLVMGIGALAIAAGHTLRRKIKAVSPANA